MAIPDFQSLMLPVLKLGATGEVRGRDAVQIIADQFNLSEQERAETVPSGTRTYILDRILWAVTYLVKAGLLQRPQRGCFTITEKGKEVLASKPESIDINFLKQFPEFEKFKTRKKPEGSIQAREVTEESQTPRERIDSAYEEIFADLKSEVLQRILDASPQFFEKLLLNVLVAMGYGGSLKEAGKHVGKSGDEGIDGVINEDKLGLDIIYIQAKRYAPENTVSRPDIQKFAGSLMGKGANKGVFVTTSSFSKKALEYAERITQRLILIDGEQLASLMIEHNVGVRLNHAVELKTIDEDFFLE